MTITLHGTNGVTTDGITLGSTAIASTGAEINILDGVTSTAAELNILDGVTSTTAELNILDGVTSTAAELNIMDGVTATAAEINLIDGGTARGTTALADGDGILINDAGTMRMSTVQTVKTYMTDGVGASTTAGAVGTYTFGRPENQTNYTTGDTASGIYPLSHKSTSSPYRTQGTWNHYDRGSQFSGTWRAMSEAFGNNTQSFGGLWVRVS